MPATQKKSAEMKASERWRTHHFLAAWMRSPLKVGAVAPTSRGTTHAMAQQVDLAVPGMVVELGGGTGAVTQALLHSGIPNDRLMVVERDPKLHALLCTHYPNVKIVCGDARDLRELLAENGVSELCAIVSSLPLLSMPKEARQKIEEEVLLLGKEHGAPVVKITYGPASAITVQMLHKHHMVGKRVKFIMANIPPAHVWVYRKK